MIHAIKKLSLLILVISYQSFSQSANYEALDEFLTILEDNHKLMGTITITKDNSTVFSRSLGYSDVSNKIKNTSKTKFRIGSVTKAFTATMIFQLIDEGKITLDSPLTLFFNDIPGASKITIAHLLNHSSGLFNITNDSSASEWTLKPSSREDMLKRIKSYKLDFSPGEHTAYSNTNYMILGYIIEILDKDDYMQALDRRIVKKINLDNTHYGSVINSGNNESHSYFLENDSWVMASETEMSNPGGAGAIVSTSQDLTQFMNALFTGKLIASSSLEAMKRTNNNEVCHGIFYANMNGIDLYASEGSIDGFQSMLAYVPDTKTTIALTANGLDFSKMRIMLSAFAVSNGNEIVLPNFAKIELSEAQAKLYDGTYTSDEVPFKLIFKANGNVLLGAPEDSALQELTSTKQHQFTLESIGVVLDFYPETGLVRFIKGTEQPIIFKKL